MSHELRTPLSVITGYADILAKTPVDSKIYKDVIAKIQKNAGIELSLVEDVLDISKIITGRMKCEMAPLSIANLIDSSIDTIKLAAQTKSISIIRPNVPENATISGDEESLRQVFWNLLTNAIKFTPKYGTIELSYMQQNESVIFIFTDSGCGISADYVDKVFDRFWQQDMSVNRKHSGLGLGLAISRKIIELHGGEIECYSEGKDRGTTFKVELPTAISKSHIPEQAQDRKEPTMKYSMFQPQLRLTDKTILLIEDADDVREMLTLSFEMEGATVFAFP